MLEQIKNGLLIQETKMNTLQDIQFITKITAESIRNCWHHTKILPNANRMEIDITDDTTIDDLSELINILHLSDPMQVDEFLFIPEENSVRCLKKTLMRVMSKTWQYWDYNYYCQCIEKLRKCTLVFVTAGERIRLLNNLERFVSEKTIFKWNKQP